MMELLQIEFLTENCETIHIDGQCVGDFLIDHLPELCSNMERDSVAEGVCHYFYIEIYKAGNKEYQPYPEASIDSIFARLQRWNDITYIKFYLFDPINNIQKLVRYLVEWAGLYDENNDNQVSYLGNQGTLYIMIG